MLSQARENRNKIGPYSRRLRRGAIGDMVDGRSTIGRFCRDLEAQLVRHCGGAPSITQRLLIDRLIRTTAQLDALDRKLMNGEAWSDHDSRTHGGLINRQRLLLREIGLQPTAPRAPSLADHLARKAAEREVARRAAS
jgi:hypothetical protein